MSLDKKTCEKNMYYASYMTGSHKCGRPAKMEHKGKRYCGIHDPVKREAKFKEKLAIRLDKIEERRDERIYTRKAKAVYILIHEAIENRAFNLVSSELREMIEEAEKEVENEHT